MIANKVDSEKRAISKKEGEIFALENNMIYYEISAINGEGFGQFEDDLINTIKLMANPEMGIVYEKHIIIQ